MYGILYPKTDNNLCTVVWFLSTRLLGIRTIKTAINTLLENHIESPSFLSVKDTLAEYGIESAAVRKGSYTYAEFETPFVCAIQQEDWGRSNFTVVTEARADKITYLDPLTGKLNVISTAAFEQLDKEVILLVDGSATKDDPFFRF